MNGENMPFDIPPDSVFDALADKTRRQMLARLSEGPATVSELSAPFDISQPAVSRHLKVLETAGLIRTRIDAQRRPRELQPDAMTEVSTWLNSLTAQWEAQFQRLDAVLDDLQANKEEDPK